MKFAIVTPTIGTPHLKKCIQSVQNQSYDNITHYIFADGEEHYVDVHSIIFRQLSILPEPTELSIKSMKTIKTISLDENVGKGWYGHRVYAACSFLVNADMIIYLDEDNWLEPTHVEEFYKLFKMMDWNPDSKDLQWAYSLRKIYNKEEKFICNDDCESLGLWPVFFDEAHHIDTSCFCIPKRVAVQIGHSWYAQGGADRKFFSNLSHYFNKFTCTGKYTLCYRLDGNDNSVTADFFLKGNQINKQKYHNKFPWPRENWRHMNYIKA